MKIRYMSLFSGIEAFSCAVKNISDFEPVAFSEVDPFACAVLKRHYPSVPNLGDVRNIDGRLFNGLVDLIVGGAPCQDWSVAGKRLGVDGQRSVLAFEYIRIIGEVLPKWVIFENVPGLFSCHNGADFQLFLQKMDELRYSCAWSVLDSQYFKLAQRRRRIFLVGHLGNWRNPAKVLLEPESMCRNPPPRRQAREADPAGTEEGAGNRGVSGTLCASGAGLDRPSASGNQLDYLITHTHTHTAAGVPNRPGNGEAGNSQQHPRHTNAQRPHAKPDKHCHCQPLSIVGTLVASGACCERVARDAQDFLILDKKA